MVIANYKPKSLISQILTEINEARINPGGAIARHGKHSEVSRLLAIRGERLRLWRKVKGYSIFVLANLLDVHPNTIGNWEAGGSIPYQKLESLVALGFPKKHAEMSDGK